MEFSTSAAQRGAFQEQSFHSCGNMFKRKSHGCYNLEIYLPLVHFTSPLISAGKLSPGFLEKFNSSQRFLTDIKLQGKHAAKLTSGSSQGVVSRDIVEDIMESPTLPRGEGGSHCVVPVGMCQ